MRLVLTVLLSLGLSGCMAKMRAYPNPPRSLAELEPAQTLEERKEQFDQHAFSAAKKTTTVTSTQGNSTSVRQYQDLSLLAQDGSYYRLENYLPELQKVDIAGDVENPANHYDAVNKQRIYGTIGVALLVGAPLAGVLLQSDCGTLPDYREEAALASYYDCGSSNSAMLVYGTIGGLLTGSGLSIYGLSKQSKAAGPIRKAKAVATKNRTAWAREWNKKLMKKLGLQEAPSVTKSP